MQPPRRASSGLLPPSHGPHETAASHSPSAPPPSLPRTTTILPSRYEPDGSRDLREVVSCSICITTGVPTSLQDPAFNAFGYIPRVASAGHVITLCSAGGRSPGCSPQQPPCFTSQRCSIRAPVSPRACQHSLFPFIWWQFIDHHCLW